MGQLRLSDRSHVAAALVLPFWAVVLVSDWCCGRADILPVQVLGHAQKFQEELDSNPSGAQEPDGHAGYLRLWQGTRSKAPAREGPWIIGSKLKSALEVQRFRRRWACLSSANSSTWQRDPRPRLLPWASKDIFFSKFQHLGHLDGSQLNEAFRRGAFHADPDSWPAPERVKYKWALKEGRQLACGPHPPNFQKIDTAGFCSALRRSKGSLFFVGDSMTAVFIGSFIAQLSAQGEPITKLGPTPACSALIDHLQNVTAPYAGQGTYPPCMRWRICGHSDSDGGVDMHFIVSCHLQWVHRGAPTARYGASKWCLPFNRLFWGEEAVREKASIVVLNRGLHFVPKGQFREQLEFTLQELRRMLPRALLVYRSTTPGHPNCSAYDKPVSKALDMSQAPYHWGEMPEEDMIARELVEGDSGVHGAFLDLSPMQSLRPDGHFHPGSDCLHYKIPGSADSWPPFFAAMVQELV